MIKVGTDAEGRQLVQGFLVDITDRKHAEAQLLEAELSYRTLVEQRCRS